MEARWIEQRARIRYHLRVNPDWTIRQTADAVGCSTSTVSVWKQRFAQADPFDVNVLLSRSRARHHPPPSLDQEVISRVLELRLAPPDGLQRVPGPKALLYYLHRDASLLASGKRLPRSTRTVWRLLRKHGMILDPRSFPTRPWDLPDPLQDVQMDLKDASTVAPDPEGKKQHTVEVLNFVDTATSILLDAQVHADFHAQTAFEGVVTFLRKYGLPDRLTFDRDPRWVGSASARDFPSALSRFLLCVGVQPTICPPRHPELNGFVQRYHRSYKYECLRVQRPSTLEEVRAVTEQYAHHDNFQRPHQGRSCQNRPPRVVFPVLPQRPCLPAMVDPDAWLTAFDGQVYLRKVKTNGQVMVDSAPYYVKSALAGQVVTLVVNAAERVFDVLLGQDRIKQLPLKGLVGVQMRLDASIDLMKEQARSEERTRLLVQRHHA
jgi:transposase InsO family protein